MRRMITIICILCITTALTGCGLPTASLPPSPITASAPSAAIQPSHSLEATDTPLPSDEGVPSITLGDEHILSTGATLAQLGGYLKMTKNDILSILGAADTTISNGWAQTYHFTDPGINIVCRDTKPDHFENKNLYTTFIECDADKVQLAGVKKGMDFAQIQDKLGKTGVQKVERVPGICSYELRYIVNRVRLKFFSWKIDGSDTFNLNIVKTFNTDDDFIRITPEKIGEWFSKSKGELRQIFGGSEELPDRSAVMLSYYQKYGMAFVNQRDGNKEYFDHISLDGRYEINGAREGMNLYDIMDKLGKHKIEVFDPIEDPYLCIRYQYKTFWILCISDGFTGEEPVDTMIEIIRR